MALVLITLAFFLFLQDVMDHALHESGMGGLQAIVEFFDDRVINYNRHMLKTCRKLHQTYHKVRMPQGSSSDDSKHIKSGLL